MTSPRITSRLSPFMNQFRPKTDHEVANLDDNRTVRLSFIHPTGLDQTFVLSKESDAGEEHGENPIDHDHHEDGFNDRCRDLAAKRFG